MVENDNDNIKDRIRTSVVSYLSDHIILFGILLLVYVLIFYALPDYILAHLRRRGAVLEDRSLIYFFSFLWLGLCAFGQIGFTLYLLKNSPRFMKQLLGLAAVSGVSMAVVTIINVT